MADRSTILPKLIGKRIKGIVTTNDKVHHPKGQIMLIFSDNTYYEFYADDEIYSRSELDEGGLKEIIEWIRGCRTKEILFQACNDNISD